jgi:toxin-antitoxin system PIN domain toxin
VTATSLLDVNVLIAAAWPTHTAHEKVQAWFATATQPGWATCPMTELAFVRILSNPAFSPHALTPRDAATLLQANLAHPAHAFWADDLPFSVAVRPYLAKLNGHQQLTDAYLLALASHHKGKLITLDRSLKDLLPDKLAETEFLQIL